MTKKPPARLSRPPTPPGSPAPAHGDGPTGPSAPTGRTERFEGHDGRECGEHRSTGHRAWCFDDSEWCYPTIPCRGCELPKLRAALTAQEEATMPEPADRPPLRDEIAEALHTGRCCTGHIPRITDAVLHAIEAETAALRQRAEQAERERDEALAAVADEQQRADDRRTELLEERDEALNALADAERERDEALEALAYGAETLRHAEQAERELPPVEHVRGANAEDCPACAGRRDLPYPFICPGTDPTERRPR